MGHKDVRRNLEESEECYLMGSLGRPTVYERFKPLRFLDRKEPVRNWVPITLGTGSLSVKTP